MIWKYYLPHVWDGERKTWEDVYLLPDDPAYDGGSLWLRVRALGGCATDEERRAAAGRLAGRDHLSDGAELLVAVEDFTREELLRWVDVWLDESGIQKGEFVEDGLDESSARGARLRASDGTQGEPVG